MTQSKRKSSNSKAQLSKSASEQDGNTEKPRTRKRREKKKKFLSFEPQIFSISANVGYITKNRELYTWGKHIGNAKGEFGMGETVDIYKPTLYPFLTDEKVLSLQYGEHHVLCQVESKKNQLYVWGYNRCGQLGLGPENTSNQLHPTSCQLPPNETIFLICVGINHSVCLTEKGNCYVWGSNEYGTLGLESFDHEFDIICEVPTLLTLPNNEKISFIACGFYHTICLTENNLCYVWGRNGYGQLGLGDITNHLTPTLLTLPNTEKISFITCGSAHTICLTEDNLCYVWGWNYYGQLGLGDTTDRLTPTLLTLPNNERLFYISSGFSHVVCMTENNLCYVWGWNEHGQLGLGHTRMVITPTLFELPDHKHISHISCSGYSTFCITTKCKFFSWGYNGYGQIGIGLEDTYILTPLEISLPK